MENKTMLIDFYEFTMAQTYFYSDKKDEEVYFDVFFRKNPFEGGYTIMGGLDNIIKYLQDFRFSDEDIEYLREQNKFGEEFLQYLKDLKFDGDIFAIPDGTPVFPNEPLVTVRAKAPIAQLIETALLTNFNHGALVTTAAKRITNEAGDIPVMEFGARRARGEESSVEASKCAYIGGCVGTSNTLAGRKYKVPVMGTMAHSLVTEADSEYEAFLEYAKYNPDNCIFLVDTYDTLRSGIPNAIRVAKEYLESNNYKFKGIRIDSGDLTYLSKEARKMLDEAGFPDAGICLSNGLNEYTISDIIKNGAKINSFGVGDNIAAPKERVGGVYKLAAIKRNGEIIPRIKISEDAIKIINPGYKKVYRIYDNETGFAKADVIALHNENIPTDKYTLIHPEYRWKKTEITNYTVKELQVPIFKNGVLVYDQPNLEERRKYCTEQFSSLYPEVTRLINPHEHWVDLTEGLYDLKNSLIEEHTVKTKKIGVMK